MLCYRHGLFLFPVQTFPMETFRRRQSAGGAEDTALPSARRSDRSSSPPLESPPSLDGVLAMSGREVDSDAFLFFLGLSWLPAVLTRGVDLTDSRAFLFFLELYIPAYFTP